MDSETVRLYVGVNETKWNHHPVAPGPWACVAPVYGRTERTKVKNPVSIPDDTMVLSDSGAFSDGPSSRLLHREAMERQLAHAEQYGYVDRLAGFASYDLLIDEKWTDGMRSKRRWGESDAWAAVDETVGAARFLHERRHAIPSRLVLSAQGVTANQYLECVQSIAPFFRDGDALGLGGWCILGQRRSLMPIFRETVLEVIPAAATFTKSVHIWGVLYAPAIGELLWMCDQHGLKLSTDSSGPSVRPARGVWGYMGWIDKGYKRPPVAVRGLERARHVDAVREWLDGFRKLEYYRNPEEVMSEV
jgi:hypothetical protein